MYRTACRTILSILVFTLLLSSSAAWSRRMPRGSFLIQPAYSAAQLASQIRTNPTVAHRYYKHFGVPALPLAQYAQTQLGLRPLPRGDKYRVFFVTPDGRIVNQVRYLPKGTPVFLHLRSGKPVLLGKCGNPLTAGLPGYIPPRPTAAPQRDTIPRVKRQEEQHLEPPVMTTVLFEPTEPPAFPPLEPVVLSPWQADPVLSLLAPEPPSAPVTHRVRPNLTPLLLVGLLGLLESGGKPANPPPVIPEPASLASVAVATVLLLAVERKRKGKRQVR